MSVDLFCCTHHLDTHLKPGDEGWLGAWWLGQVIMTVVIIIWAIPVLLFPQRLPKKNITPVLCKNRPSEASIKTTDVSAMAKGNEQLS